MKERGEGDVVRTIYRECDRPRMEFIILVLKHGMSDIGGSHLLNKGELS